MSGLNLRSAKRFKLSIVPERISVPYYRLSGNDWVIKVCPNLSFRYLPLSSSVFQKVCKGVDFQLVYSVSPFPAFLTYFFEKIILRLYLPYKKFTFLTFTANSSQRIFLSIGSKLISYIRIDGQSLPDSMY